MFSRKSNGLMKIGNYEEARVKLTNTQLTKSKFAAENNTLTTLRITKNKYQDNEELPHESFLTTKQKKKEGNVFAKNMLTDIKLRKASCLK